MPESLAVALDLVLAPFGEGQPETASAGARADELDRDGLRRTVVEHGAPTPAPEGAGRHSPLHVCLVDARERVARVEEPVGQRTIVGQEEQALDVPVEAPDRVETRADVRKVSDPGASFRPVMRMRRRSSRFSSTPSEFTPRTASSSGRDTGCL